MSEIRTCNCGAKVRVPANLYGRGFRCPRCKAEIAASPAAAYPAAAPPAYPPVAPTGYPAQGQPAYSAPQPSTPAETTPAPEVDVPWQIARKSMGTCPICQSTIAESEMYVVCPLCEQVHHNECWREIGGCSTYGCDKAPAVDKEGEQTAPTSAWGDNKMCPACGEQIRAIAMRCRYCGTDFHTVDPLTAQDLRKGVRKDKEVGDLRTHVVILFVMAVTGCLAPLALIIGSFYFFAKWEMLHKAGPVHQILAYFTLALSTLYTLLMFVFLLQQ